MLLENAAIGSNSLSPVKIKITDKLNRPLRDFRISVTDRCNLRCRYCMPGSEEGKKYCFIDKDKFLSKDEIIRIVSLLVDLGIEKVRLTGGEPLLRPDIIPLIKDLKARTEIQDLALTTNGLSLKNHARELYAAGLDRITVSLDTLDPTTFKDITGKDISTNKILKGIEEAELAGFKSLKINAVILKGVNENSILGLTKFFKGTNHILRFIEFMDVGNSNNWSKPQVFTSKEIYDLINNIYPLYPLAPNYSGEVAQRYGFKNSKGEIGFISSVSQPFCQDCSRIRLSADGKIYTCLFSDNGINIKGLLSDNKSDSKLKTCLVNAWKRRDNQYSEERNKLLADNIRTNKIEMFQIGG